MDQIGVRELRQNASVYLARVKDGESIEITERGVPIAVLGPPTKMSVIDRLIAEGKATPARGSLVEWLRDNPPGDPLPGDVTLSDVLQQMRDEEYR
jgi:prevent-host-death family protein